ncbi:MAG: hypothetical protein K8L91_02085 [Anaerolineae bacterium]|nr:hypothetical protein [Anaerolineae bacterium]
MAIIHTAVWQTLEAHSPLTTLLTGGIFDAADLGRQGLQPDTPHLYRGHLLKPCAVIHWRGAAEFRPHYAAEKRTFEIHFYQDSGTTTIGEALRLTKKLMHRAQIEADNGGLWWVNWVSDSSEFTAAELGGASAKFSRYEAIYLRE